ncbi:AsmA family protein [Pseudochryseolinea flava]|uniref:AsmA-like C-terminal domain-containing protein n=1 Tax=Pseudochryseolinea flava TaxID=2059302 RepID=A0A364Y290_9BACT|nr:AsmA-like C-terminal region-containing protein [Pseudochryseolinea flava]RAW00760.1 hypothetical protein DQQ10_12900 [Pseudochryseolinea flava]
MNPRIKKWLVRPLIIVAITLSTLLTVAFLLVSLEQDRLVKFAVGELNKTFKGELTIDDSNISLFKHFPYVSIALHNGNFFPDKSKTQKPIAQFEHLYVGFSIDELIQHHYNVKVLFIEKGFVNLVQDKNGKINLLEAEKSAPQSTTPSAASDTTSSVAINLKKVVLRDMKVSYLHAASGQNVNAHIEKMSSSLQIDSLMVLMAIKSEMKLDVTSNTDTTFFRNKRFLLDIEADYKLKESTFNIFACNFKIEDAGFNVTGNANFADTTSVHFKVKGDKQDFKLFSAFIPEHVKHNLKPFQYDGRLYFDALIQGKISDNHLPLIEVAFGCEEGWFLNTGANKKIDKLGFTGYYTNGHEHSLKTSEVHIINVSARPEKGIFRGNFVVRDFTDPKTLVQINSELELKFLGEFLGIADLQQTSGNIKLDMNFKELNDIKLPEESLNKLKEGIQSKLTVTDLSFRIPGFPHAVKEVNLHAEMKDGKVTVDSGRMKIGSSDLRLNGSISDVRAFLRERDKTINLKLNAKSDQMILSELMSYDTALARKWNEEIRGFNVTLALETTVRELLNPSPLPKGKFEMTKLRATFKNYPHTFKDLNATVMINDTLLRLRDFTGMIDSSDINFKGRITNYNLWFDNIKKGKTQIAFDFKSNRFGMKDVLGKESRKYIPRGYRRELLTNVWLRMKIDLKYDTIFRFAKAKVTNITADLQKHNLKLHEISGGIKYGSKILSFDTLRGKIGNSDFDISLKYYFKGVDRNNNKVSNSLNFASKFLDADEISQYDLAPKKGRSRRDTTKVAVAEIKVDSSAHAKSFNIFSIPFSNFNAQIDIGKLKYNRLWLKDVSATVRMQEDQTITLDTLVMQVAGGNVRMRGKFNGANHERIYFRSRINIDDVDLEKMLLKLDHFGQDVVVNKNVKGRLSGQIKSYVQVHPNLVPIMNNTKAEMNVKITNGTLVDFAPMQAMASYFKDKNLRLIRFDTLHNTLTFSNGVLDIPAMKINSSLGYIQMSGKQSLDMSMEYYVRVPMKMVTKVGFNSLFSKKPEEVDMNQVDEIEYIDADKKIAFMNLKITGTPSDYKVGLGKNKDKKTL